MNTPNKLTILRIILVPVFMAFLLIQSIPYHLILATACFLLASITDLIDGKLARKNNQITTFGKFLDPLADKLLVAAALVCFVELHYTSAVVAMIIIAREFLVTALRLVTVNSGKVIAANIWGKVKTNSQMIAIIAVMVFQSVGSIPALNLTGQIFLWIAALLTVISGIQYVWVNRGYIDTYK